MIMNYAQWLNRKLSLSFRRWHLFKALCQQNCQEGKLVGLGYKRTRQCFIILLCKIFLNKKQFVTL